MISVLILTHGGVATELLATARVIAGGLENFHALALPWSADREVAQAELEEILPNIDRGDGVLVLTDIYGSTPTNAAMDLRREGRVEVVSGVNLPMVVRIGCLGRRDMPMAELAAFVRDKAKKSICCGGDLPRRRRPDPCSDPLDGTSSEVAPDPAAKTRSKKVPRT